MAQNDRPNNPFVNPIVHQAPDTIGAPRDFFLSASSDTMPGYSDPTKAALQDLIEWINLNPKHAEGEDAQGRLVPAGVAVAWRSTFYAQRHAEPSCLYDIAYVWLVEGDAVRSCPTYESWLLFLIAFADATHYFRDENAFGDTLRALTLTDFFPTDEQLSRTRNLDLLSQGVEPRGIEEEPGRLFYPIGAVPGAYQHPVLRHDIYDVCAAQYQRLLIGSPV